MGKKSKRVKAPAGSTNDGNGSGPTSAYAASTSSASASARPTTRSIWQSSTAALSSGHKRGHDSNSTSSAAGHAAAASEKYRSSLMSGRTVRVPALVLTRLSAGHGGEAEDEGDLPVAFERPNYSGGPDGGLPLIPLWEDDLAASASTSGTGTAGCRSVGRRDLLLAYYNGCGCLCAAGQCNSGRRLPLCSACRNVELWGTTYLSREMIRLLPAGDLRFALAVRGANRAMVRVDGIPVCDEESQRFQDAADNGGSDNGGDDDWFVGDADLTAGSVLSIECSRDTDGAGTEGAVPAIGRLAFVLQNIDVDLDVNTEEPVAGRRRLVAIIPEREGLGRQEIVVKLGGIGLGNNSGGARISTGAAKLSLKPPSTSVGSRVLFDVSNTPPKSRKRGAGSSGGLGQPSRDDLLYNDDDMEVEDDNTWDPAWTLLCQHQSTCNVRCTICSDATAVATWEDPFVPGHQAIRHSCMACQKDKHDVGPNGWPDQHVPITDFAPMISMIGNGTNILLSWSDDGQDGFFEATVTKKHGTERCPMVDVEYRDGSRESDVCLTKTPFVLAGACMGRPKSTSFSSSSFDPSALIPGNTSIKEFTLADGGASTEHVAEAEKLRAKDPASLTPMQMVVLRTVLDVQDDRLDKDDLVVEALQRARTNSTALMVAAVPSLDGKINQGDPGNKEATHHIEANYATKECLAHCRDGKTLDPLCVMYRNNCSLRMPAKSMPSSLKREDGGDWTPELEEYVDTHMSMSDYNVVVPKK